MVDSNPHSRAGFIHAFCRTDFLYMHGFIFTVLFGIILFLGHYLSVVVIAMRGYCKREAMSPSRPHQALLVELFLALCSLSVNKKDTWPTTSQLFS
jgi:hypothetical protein